MRIRGSSYVRVTVGVVVMMVAAQAWGTVTQVDGTIVPRLNNVATCDGGGAANLQVCFNQYEGVSPPSPNAIDPIVDAAQIPEIFVPNTAVGVSVTFRDIAEGAGFENSFGYYNVGDDVVTPAGIQANLHPILGCGVPMTTTGNASTHKGNPAFYLQNAEPNFGSAPASTASVNFATEASAGRYRGGFIGFYLITPEGNPSANNCGDFKLGTDALSLLGRLYYTQKDLNNDGDFVHHLVYSSKVVANRFYFGFEDLYRGGDNDFEDMAIQTIGLTAPCVPQPEICDNLDNDCDGLIDNTDPDLTGVNAACNCDGISQTCDNGPLQGTCQTGVTRCTAGAITCHGTGVATAETCDLKDNNCNGMVDDNPSGTGATCDGPDADLCKEGTFQCMNGVISCTDTTGNNVELCNGLDDDCDGAIDNGNPGGGGACGTGTGQCNPGTLVCQGGGLVCTGQTGPSPELCNGLDDDCNGVIDNTPTGVGAACGASDTGACMKGMTVCVNGGLQCAGEVGPSPERCNGIDDDCNGIIDDNVVDDAQPCGTGTGACDPGATQCVMGMLMCTGGTGPTPEVCDAIDNDCDATVDEQVPGVGDTCGAGGMGPCSMGTKQCIQGTLQCVGGTSGGTETCNGADDDCDGVIDNGDLCNGGICQNGTCASPCLAGEFPCPSGKTCVGNFCVDDPCFGVTCQPDSMGNTQTCRDGTCQAVCPTITCPSGTICRGSDAACVPDTCEYIPNKCAANQLCVNSMCVSDPCQGVTCGTDQFCRGGACVASCEGIQCPVANQCEDGACVPTGCAFDCGDQVCNPATHQCQDNACRTVTCPSAQACDPLTGMCIADPCEGVTCPGQQRCHAGQCGDITSGEFVTTGGGGGCDASGTGGDASVGALLAVAIGGLLMRRRKRLVAMAVPGIFAVALGAAGCNVNEYCLHCAIDDAGIDPNGDGGTDGSGSGIDAQPTCDPNAIHPESCNNADDDCDGQIDEGIDLQSDELNCGACGTQCNKPGAVTQCQTGGCVVTGCFPGFNDADGDITGPYATTNGCEYQCFTSNGGTEVCDELDNDCDNQIDEGINKSADPNNCGTCGHVCDFFSATGSCVASTCSFNPATDCLPGFFDINGVQADGCEYSCTPTGPETCDVIDNNCNGLVDETFDLPNDVNNCGRCGNACSFPHATATCQAGTCSFNPATQCLPGFVDVDGNQLNGCEYQCTPTNGGVERCDGVDNNCNGTADELATGVGAACAATNPAIGACTATGTTVCSGGTLVCSNAPQPVIEVCNNVDDDCNGVRDNGVTQVCYTGTAGTSGVGACRPGSQTCAAGTFGACAGEVTPGTEVCNGLDDNCDGRVDNRDAAGNPIVATCYGGTAGTAGVGTCTSGSQTCSFGSLGSCVGEVRPAADLCGDNLDTDCDAKGDAAEGCLAQGGEVVIDGEATRGAQHSYDVVLARGGVPLGTNVYAAWSQFDGTNTDVYFRKSADGGVTYGPVVNVTAAVALPAVKPLIAVQAGANDVIAIGYQTVNATDERDIRVSVSANGSTFGAASAILDAAGDSFHHSIAISGANIVIAWEELDTTTLTRDIHSRASTDTGATFGTERIINTAVGTRYAGRPQVVFAGARVVWTWREQRLGSTRDIFGASAANATTAQSAPIRIDGAGSADTRDSDFPVMVSTKDGATYLVWQDASTVAGGGSDVVFSRSLDGGVSWAAETIIDDPAMEVSSSFSPSIAVDPLTTGANDDLVAIAWEDRRQGTQVFVSVSATSGATFAAPVRASSTAGAPIAGTTTLPVIAAAGNGVLVVSYQNQLTNQRPHVYTASSIDSGATWTLSQARLDGGAGPAIAPVIVASRPGTSFAAVTAWTDFRTLPNINGDIYAVVSR